MVFLQQEQMEYTLLPGSFSPVTFSGCDSGQVFFNPKACKFCLGEALLNFDWAYSTGTPAAQLPRIPLR